MTSRARQWLLSINIVSTTILSSCKLGRWNIPACIVRVLIQTYTGQQGLVSWVGVFSDYFRVLNGVKQGGVLSPVLFCVYINELLLKLSAAGVGC